MAKKKWVKNKIMSKKEFELRIKYLEAFINEKTKECKSLWRRINELNKKWEVKYGS